MENNTTIAIEDQILIQNEDPIELQNDSLNLEAGFKESQEELSSQDELIGEDGTEFGNLDNIEDVVGADISVGLDMDDAMM